MPTSRSRAGTRRDRSEPPRPTAAEDVDAPGGDLHDEQHVEAPQSDGVEVEEVDRKQSLRLRAQEGPPLGVHAARGRPEPGAGEDAPDGAGTDPVAEADQLTLDPAVPPARILLRQAENQLPYLAADWWPSPPVRVGPMALNQPTVPAQQGRWRDDPMRPQPAWERPGHRREHRAIGPGQPGRTDLAAQHRNLVPQHHQLCGLAIVVPGE